MITVTREDVLANMQDVVVKTVVEFDKPCTYVTVRMKNGFTLRESTTCVDPANYNEEIGTFSTNVSKHWDDSNYRHRKHSLPGLQGFRNKHSTQRGNADG